MAAPGHSAYPRDRIGGAELSHAHQHLVYIIDGRVRTGRRNVEFMTDGDNRAARAAARDSACYCVMSSPRRSRTAEGRRREPVWAPPGAAAGRRTPCGAHTNGGRPATTVLPRPDPLPVSHTIV
jgi:hypothetical protein